MNKPSIDLGQSLTRFCRSILTSSPAPITRSLSSAGDNHEKKIPKNISANIGKFPHDLFKLIQLNHRTFCILANSPMVHA